MIRLEIVITCPPHWSREQAETMLGRLLREVPETVGVALNDVVVYREATTESD